MGVCPSFAGDFLPIAEMGEPSCWRGDIFRSDQRRRRNMAGSNHGPFWNQDAVMAAGLAFAGLAVMQSKLFPVLAGLNEPLLSKLAVWWPLLLIVAGVAVWIKRKSEKRSRGNHKARAIGSGK
jgi:hypothetical protein